MDAVLNLGDEVDLDQALAMPIGQHHEVTLNNLHFAELEGQVTIDEAVEEIVEDAAFVEDMNQQSDQIIQDQLPTQPEEIEWNTYMNEIEQAAALPQ